MLRDSLPGFLGQEFRRVIDYRVVVVDYGCPERAGEWCRDEVDDPRLVVVSVRDDVETFNLPRARNIGARFGRNGVLAFVDADVTLSNGCLADALDFMAERGLDRLNQSRGTHRSGKPWVNGQVLLRADAFAELRGYDERMRFWGGDDIDLYRRSIRAGHLWAARDLGLRARPHGDEERVRYVNAETREEARLRNQELRRERGDAVVNPFGWGVTSDYEVWSPPASASAAVRVPYSAGSPVIVRRCRCEGAGWCNRHRSRKTADQVLDCLLGRPSVEKWEEGRAPGQRMEVRNPEESPLQPASGDITELDGVSNAGGALLPDEMFRPIFEPMRGRRVALAKMPGNVGDALIRRATYQLAERFGVDCYEADPETDVEADEWVIAGGGKMGGRFGRCQAIRKQVLAHDKPVTVLPQTFATVEFLPYSRVYVRELESLRYRPDAMLAPDLALGYRVDTIDVESDRDQGLWLRQDGEGLFKEVPCDGDPARVCRTPDDYLRLAARHESVVTDRLHFAIAALITGRSATLLPNRSIKNRSMHLTWLGRLGCQWLEAPPGVPPPEKEPGLLRRAANFARAITKHSKDGMRKVAPEVRRARLETCRACPSCDIRRMICRERSCGCYLATKASWRSERCPVGKWQSVNR